MLLNKKGENMAIDGKKYSVGAKIYCNSNSAYWGLSGRIIGIRDGEDKESDNETVDIVCELSLPEKEDDRAIIAQRFSELWGLTVSAENIALDYVIMSAEMIEFADIPTISDDDIIAKVAEKLAEEANTIGTDSINRIAVHLSTVCESNIQFVELIIQPHKTLQKCYNYISEQVRKTLAKGANSACVADDIVYKMAEDYYRLDDAEIERQKEENKKKREAELTKAKEERAKNSTTSVPVRASAKPVDDTQLTIGFDDETEENAA